MFASLNTSYDLDGILCDDPPANLQKEEYAWWMVSAPVKVKPDYKIYAIITGRVEKYREITEFWLRKEGFSYQYLIMKPNILSGVEKTPLFKAICYIFLYKSKLFIESCKKQAEKVHFYSRKPVFCLENNKLYIKGESHENTRKD